MTYIIGLPKRSSKPPRDLNALPKLIVDEATSDDKPEAPSSNTDEQNWKNPAAVVLGRLGGKKGGPAQAKKVTAEQRSESARKAADARWQSGDKSLNRLKNQLGNG